jgi:hypothetical protein
LCKKKVPGVVPTPDIVESNTSLQSKDIDGTINTYKTETDIILADSNPENLNTKLDTKNVLECRVEREVHLSKKKVPGVHVTPTPDIVDSTTSLQSNELECRVEREMGK